MLPARFTKRPARCRSNTATSTRTRQRGLYGIMKRARYRSDYDEVVREVAQRILDTAKRSPAGPWPAVNFGDLQNPFAPAGAPESGAARLLITVLAPQWDDVPAWSRRAVLRAERRGTGRPYRPASRQPIAQFTANFARSMGYRPTCATCRSARTICLATGRPPIQSCSSSIRGRSLRPDCRPPGRAVQTGGQALGSGGNPVERGR